MQFSAGDAIAVVAVAIGIAMILTGPIGAALAERIRGAAAPADDHGLAAEVDNLRGRLADVEERLDFAERLLAQAHEADRLHGGAQR